MSEKGTGALSEGKVRALVMVVSRNEAVDTAVAKFKPKVLGVISSQNFIGQVAKKCAELEPEVRVLYRLVDSAMEIHDSFERFEHLLAELESLGYTTDSTVLDVSGGTTPMRLGAALAAMQRGVRMVHQRVVQDYVAGDWKVDPERKREVVPMENPLESSGLLREGQATELFDRRDYSAAALVFRDVLEKVTGVERRHYYRGLLLLSEGYAAWDVADYPGAMERLRSAGGEFSVSYSTQALSERASSLLGTVRGNLEFIGRFQGKLSMEAVVDMLENARRRIQDQGRYDDGVARLYRCVEMLHQFNLERGHGLSTTGVKWSKVPEETRATFLQRTGFERLPDDLDLMRARTLERILSGTEEVDEDVLRDLLQKRNRSILAHGFEPIKESSAKTFLAYVERSVDRPNIAEKAKHPYLSRL